MRRDQIAKHRWPHFPDAHAALGRLQGTLKHLAHTDIVTRTLARREAVMSSQIEGTKSTLQQLLTYEATHEKGSSAGGRTDHRALRHCASARPRARPREDEQTDLTIFAQLAIAHAQFETIRPYHDGHGRTRRLLMPLMLAAEGYPPLYPSGALLRAKARYYATLASVQLKGEWGPWLELLGQAVVESCDEAISIAEGLLELAERWEHQLRSYRAHSASRRRHREPGKRAAMGPSVPSHRGVASSE